MIHIKPIVYILFFCFLCLAQSCQTKKHLQRTDQQTEQHKQAKADSTGTHTEQHTTDSTAIIIDTTKQHKQTIILRDYTQIHTAADGAKTETTGKEIVICINDKENFILNENSKKENTEIETTTDTHKEAEADNSSSTTTEEQKSNKKFAKFFFPVLFLLLLILLIYFAYRFVKKKVKKY